MKIRKRTEKKKEQLRAAAPHEKVFSRQRFRSSVTPFWFNQSVYHTHHSFSLATVVSAAAVASPPQTFSWLANCESHTLPHFYVTGPKVSEVEAASAKNKFTPTPSWLVGLSSFRCCQPCSIQVPFKLQLCLPLKHLLDIGELNRTVVQWNTYDSKIACSIHLPQHIHSS